MQINRVDNAPNFRAKLIIGDEKIQKYIKSSFMSKDTFSILDKFSEIHPDSVVSVNIKNSKNKDYLVAKNGVTGATEEKLLGNADIITLQNRLSFIDLVKKIMNKKSFWEKVENETFDFDATSITPKIEHDVFNIEK